MIFLLILSIFAIIFFVLVTAKTKIEIENLKLEFQKKDKKIINKESEILLKIYILKKIKIGQTDLKKINISDKKFKERFDKIRNKSIFQKIRKEIRTNLLEFIKKIKIEKMNLKIEIGTEDAAITAIGVGVISSAFGMMLKDKIKDSDLQKFQVIPIYENRNFFKIEINGIFEYDIVNIIDIIKSLIKGRVKENVRTSNRRSYAYSHE